MSQNPVKTGLESLLVGHSPEYKSLRSGLILHPASVTSELQYASEALIEASFNLKKLFGPQHGARGEKQDNMIESDFYTDPLLELPVYSLYGEVRKPTAEMLDGLDILFFDLQDVGVRVYTFIWTMALAMEACAEAGITFVVLDRPNPVGGIKKEGALLRSGYESFVGLHPIPLRHGLTAGEVAQWLKAERGISCNLDVITCEGLSRKMLWPETGLPWLMPSPNLPTLDSCWVYPGMVLLEGTNLSEGRGTTRPFEIFGAPWLDNFHLVKRINEAGLPGVKLRALSFEPTFNKYGAEICHGAQIHVTDPHAFESIAMTVEILKIAHDSAPADFAWLKPPYEYEEKLPPIDILWGSDALRLGIENGKTTTKIVSGVETDLQKFSKEVEPHLLYD